MVLPIIKEQRNYAFKLSKYKNEWIGKLNYVLISATGSLKNNIIHLTKNDL